MNLLPRLPLLLCCLTLSLVGCDDDALSPAETPVTLRVSGANLKQLGAELRYATTYQFQQRANPGPTARVSFDSLASQTYDLGRLGPADRVVASIAFRRVTCSDTLLPAPNTVLRLELLINNVVVQQAELNAASRPRIACAPYWQQTLSAEGPAFSQ
ncbi:hypothetical protein [Hymenobacter sp. B81]|uniref:hypothetical protein n=1 Tax=Hymenobacter sp. B81 TaxID=3344878 RepID=UPI0037DBF4A6